MHHTLGVLISLTERGKNVFVACTDGGGAQKGGPREKFNNVNSGSTDRRIEPESVPTDRRKRQPLGAGKHAAELG